jgi:hypothetical protein
MGSKRTNRRDLLKSGGALAGGLAVLGQTPAAAQTTSSQTASSQAPSSPEHEHASGQPPMIKGTKGWSNMVSAPIT